MATDLGIEGSGFYCPLLDELQFSVSVGRVLVNGHDDGQFVLLGDVLEMSLQVTESFFEQLKVLGGRQSVFGKSLWARLTSSW